MGNGVADTYYNAIRNEVKFTDQNVGKLQLNNMAANDIVNVSISGLS